MDNANLKTWWSRELATHLNIGASTLRKWSLELEKAGYIFLRDEHGRRAYVEHDTLALHQFKQMLEKGTSYDSAAKAITAKYLRNDNAPIALYANTEIITKDNYDPDYESIEFKIEQQTKQINELIEINQTLIKKLDEQEKQFQKRIEEIEAHKHIAAAAQETSFEKREQDRDDKISQILRELLEAKQQASKPIWKRIFKG